MLKQLQQRIITATVLIPLTLAAIFFSSPQTFLLLIAAFVGMVAWEWSALAGNAWPMRLAYCACVWFGLWLTRFVPPVLIYSLSIIGWLAALRWVLYYPRLTLEWNGRGALFVFGFWLLVPAWYALTALKSLPGGEWKILFALCLVWLADSGAYFSGRRWGGRKLLPSVSPGKTWAGFWGGLALAGTSGILVSFVQLGWSAQAIALMGIGAITILASVLGDLFESMIKRERGVKDSGSILPGHGGLLDRIDSLTAALPVYTGLTVWLHT